MPLFALHCVDKPDSLDLRMATREAHLAYMGGVRDMIRLGGPMQGEAETMVGSLLIIEADDLAAAKAFSAADPYVKAGLFERVDIHVFKATLGKLG